MLNTVSPDTAFFPARPEEALRHCAAWHERQAKRNPERADHHHKTARALRDQANAIVLSTPKGA